MIQRKWKKWTAILLMLTFAVNMFQAEDAGSACAAEEKNTAVNREQTFSLERLATNYTSVSAGYTAKEYSGEPVIIRMETAIDEADSSLITMDNKGYESGVVNVRHGDCFQVHAKVPQTALYRIDFEYLSYDSSILPIEFSFQVDGEFPFYETRNLSFQTTWVSKDTVDVDRYGNEIVTMPEKKICWERKSLMDASYRYSEPLLVQLEQGEHVFEIHVNEGSFLLGNITLCAPESVAAYTGSEKAEGDALIVIEGEDFYERNNSSIHAAGEYDSSVSPVSAKEKVLNTVDSDSFKICRNNRRSAV